MKMTDMRAKARAIFGPAIAEPMPKQPNGAKALQERANARGIPTYKVGGSVKKSPPQPTAAEREADRKRRESMAKSKVMQSEADTLGRAMRSEGPRYKDGGKVMPASPHKVMPAFPQKKKKSLTSDELERGYDAQRKMMLLDAARPQKPTGYSSSMKHGGKVHTSSDTARKLATEMGGMKKGGSAMKPVDSDKNPGLEKLPKDVRNKMGYMKKGGKPKKDGLAVMIAIGEPMKGMKKSKDDMKKPVKKRAGGMMNRDMMPADMTSYRMSDGGKPVKKAAGGAAKVRKGMMTPEGKITDAMNKMRGK